MTSEVVGASLQGTDASAVNLIKPNPGGINLYRVNLANADQTEVRLRCKLLQYNTPYLKKQTPEDRNIR